MYTDYWNYFIKGRLPDQWQKNLNNYDLLFLYNPVSVVLISLKYFSASSQLYNFNQSLMANNRIIIADWLRVRSVFRVNHTLFPPALTNIPNTHNMVFVVGKRFRWRPAFMGALLANKPMLTCFAIVDMVRIIVQCWLRI